MKLMYNTLMRLTVSLDSDVYNFTSAYPGGKGITLSIAIGELSVVPGRRPSRKARRPD